MAYTRSRRASRADSSVESAVSPRPSDHSLSCAQTASSGRRESEKIGSGRRAEGKGREDQMGRAARAVGGAGRAVGHYRFNGIRWRTGEWVGEAGAREQGVLQAGRGGADGERGLGVQEDLRPELIAALLVLLAEGWI